MVATSAGFVNTIDVPEAIFGAQKASRKKKHATPKWDFAEEHHEISGSKPDFGAMFPLFEPDLVQAIVAESPTWEKAFGILLALADDKMEFEYPQAPIAKDPVTDHVGFPALLDADGWEVIRGWDFDKEDHPMWCDVVKDNPRSMQSIRGRLDETDEHHSLLAREGLPRITEVVADRCDDAEVETERECRQRRGTERRLNRAKHNRRPTTSSRPCDEKKIAGNMKKCTDFEPPAWRLCRFEDRL